MRTRMMICAGVGVLALTAGVNGQATSTPAAEAQPLASQRVAREQVIRARETLEKKAKTT